MDIQDIVKNQHEYFKTEATLDVKFRLQVLKKIKLRLFEYKDNCNG